VFVLLILSVKHPGGEEVLIDEGAKDASGPFDDVGHSPDARELLEKYYVGDLDPEVTIVLFIIIFIIII
jgi:cytochrome b involved in lipid metabolism